MPIEHSQCQYNALRDSNVTRTTQLRHTLFIEYIVYLRFEASQSWRPFITKRRAENKSYKIKYKALKELEKGTPHKDVASLFGVPKNTISTWKKNKDKIFEKYNSGLISKLVKPEKYDTFSYISK